MSITYQYYKQGSTFTLVLSTAATNLLTDLNYLALNHLAVTSTVDCFVQITDSKGTLAATTASQYVMSKTETIIPYVKGRRISAIGSGAGTLYATEFLAA